MDVATSQAGVDWGVCAYNALFIAAFALYVVFTVTLAFTRPQGKTRKQ